MDTSTQKIIFSYIEQSLEGLTKENPKLDFKKKWYNLKDKAELNEFLKDTTAMANTVGLDGYIIYGYDDNSKEFMDASFIDTGIKDPNEINGLITKKVDRGFEIKIEDFLFHEHKLSLIHIPPSFDKPHTIRNYQTFYKDGTLKKEELHRIFVRKGTNITEATKYDLDFIYYDRKNIIPEYRLYMSLTKDSKFFSSKEFDAFVADMVIENTGLRPVVISELNFTIPLSTGLDSDPYDNCYFSTHGILKNGNLIIRKDEIIKKTLNISFSRSSPFNKTRLSQDDISDLNHLKVDFFKNNPINVHFYNDIQIEVKVKSF